ncbi:MULTISPECIES: Lrp/AsnC family transcriptional regulator [unclassified Sphingomonas]|uniref:Lrp/AsnC family transcriptional regulator n=1 Tax=unclassified Sphingomonas TaxID=196159 RepID=UPI000701517C|nr:MULTISPECIES: Lrp/AsnC family transcriptional regulator [unclassified Sphingomonas]KQN03862.1 AsnC family transcriptional regulator [Sphingomonas sp. Leaf25]KQN40822.1 AsnC family transcriptional regulator [Sphingomonas sp. Leaf42]KQT30177.1 AsnC family transcriptional regulator [Sphingomonas sp. Leaf407]
MTKTDAVDLDRIDYRILRVLSSQGRSSDVAIGEEAGLSSNAVARRRRQMEESGVIAGYSADINLRRIGYGLLILVQIELASQSDRAIGEFEQAIQRCTAVSKCWFVSGDVDFLALVHVTSLEDYDETYRQELSILPNVAKIRSSFVLRRVLDRATPPSAIKY